MQRNSFRNSQRGLTLIETCATLAIASILAGTALPSFIESKNKRVVDGIAAELATDLHYVRSEAVTRNEGVRISFYSGGAGRCYVIHTGSRNDCRCDGGVPAQCGNGAVALKSVFQPAGHPVQVVANVSTMRFDQTNGTATTGGTVCVVPASGREIRHVVNIMGRVRTCSPVVSNGVCERC